MSDSVESLASRFEVLWPHLSERQRRLWLGAEARELGPGGVAIVARAVGVAGDTVRRGRTELQEPLTLSYPRSRRPGGGRKRAEAGDPALVEALDKLVDPVTRGDPMSPLRWTSKSLRALAKALRDQGHQVSEQIVRRLLREAGYSLQANSKTLQGRQHPDRDTQFRYLADQAEAHLADGQPVVSVDSKKKELIGELKNAGWVSVGSDHDTAAFAVATLRNWWEHEGHGAYPNSDRLLITADGGGSNGLGRTVLPMAAGMKHHRDGLRLVVLGGQAARRAATSAATRDALRPREVNERVTAGSCTSRRPGLISWRDHGLVFSPRRLVS